VSRTARLVLFFAALLAALPMAVLGLAGLPPFGQHSSAYGDLVNALGTDLRHATNMVALVNFDVRGFDTLGEEFILFAAVTGVVMLLRGERGEDTSADPMQLPHRRREGRSEAITGLSRWLGPAILLFGVYVTLHGQLTPGGGFQGGAIVATAVMLIYLGEGYSAWRRIVRSVLLDIAEALGVGIYLVAGLVPLLAGAAYLENVLPLGTEGSMLSGGLIPILNAGVALAVAGGFLSIALEFLEETREPAEEGD